jgi:AcrR family transcriptional regulator
VATESEIYLWMRPERATRGPHPRITRDQIAAAGIAVADVLGAEGVTMRRVAAEIGCGTMSLYRHVRNKDELIELMIDTVVAEDGSLSASPSGDWRADLGAIASRTRQTMLRHPWLARLLPGRQVLGPNMLAAMELALAAVDGLGLPLPDMVAMIRAINAFVLGYVQNELAEQDGRLAPGLAESGWRRAVFPYVRQIAEAGRHPLFTRMATEAAGFAPPDAEFGWGLQRVLDGFAAAVAAADGPRGERAEMLK